MKIEIREGWRRWGVGSLGLLLALLLVAGLALPACANDMPPELPHGFTGTVMVQNQADPVPEGTLVEGFVDGVKQGQTTVNAEGRYALAVGGEASDAGKTVTFKVGGVQANETATWTSGAVNYDFDLTVPGESSFPFPLPCFIATAVYGSDTAEEIDVLREFRNAVLMPNRLGAALVWLYYEVSPPLAAVISRHDSLRTALRLGFIGPIVDILNWSHELWAEGEL
jgi:hypothetical protein